MINSCSGEFSKHIKKTPSEFLYLETGATPIGWIIAQRRVNYLKCILKKDENELVKKVYLDQQKGPVTGDFALLVENDMKSLTVTQTQVETFPKHDLKKVLKSSANAAAFEELKSKQGKHNKVKHLVYDKFEIQQYLINPNIYSSDKHTITAVRSQCVRNIKINFPKMYKYRLNCPLQCNTDTPQPDTQRHLLNCPKLNKQTSTNLNIDQVNSISTEQELIAPILSRIIRLRSRLLDDQEKTSLPGAILDHSTLQQGAAAVS